VPTFGDSKITGTAQINHIFDIFNTFIRNDGTFNPTFGAIANGITIGFRPLNNPDGPALVVHDLDVGVPFNFMVKDLGGQVSVFVDDMVTLALVANSASDSGDHVVFHNRERVTADYIANFLRAEISQIPEPQTAAGHCHRKCHATAEDAGRQYIGGTIGGRAGRSESLFEFGQLFPACRFSHRRKTRAFRDRASLRSGGECSDSHSDLSCRPRSRR